MKCPVIHDWAKLKYTIGYIWKTIFLLIIAIDKDENVYAYIDRLYVMHLDARDYLCLFLTMGRGVMINTLKKLGLVTTSSIEIVVVSYGERYSKCAWF